MNYLEKSYAAGKIPGGFFKREAKPSDAATLTARLIDRPIRPLFPSNFYNEVNVVCTVPVGGVVSVVFSVLLCPAHTAAAVGVITTGNV